jgi:hypothetical protein
MYNLTNVYLEGTEELRVDERTANMTNILKPWTLWISVHILVTSQMHSISYVYILLAHLRHVSVQAYYLQGQQWQLWKPMAKINRLFTRFFTL